MNGNEQKRSRKLRPIWLAEKLALAGEYEQARQVANSIKHEVRRARAAHRVQAIIDSNLSAG